MLVLTRKAGERIQIGDNITLVVQRVSGSRVTVGIEAPDDVKIVRGELERLVTQFSDETGSSGSSSGPESAPSFSSASGVSLHPLTV